MNVLIIGAGGREHALGWKAAQNPNVETVFVAPGNAGTALEPKLENVNIGVEAISELVAFAQEKQIELTIVGPEAPLVIGVVDAFREAGLPIFGPTQAAAQLEGSKAFTKDFLARHNICLLYTSPSPRDQLTSRMPSSASSSVIATITPLPAARPSAFTTIGAPC